MTMGMSTGRFLARVGATWSLVVAVCLGGVDGGVRDAMAWRSPPGTAECPPPPGAAYACPPATGTVAARRQALEALRTTYAPVDEWLVALARVRTASEALGGLVLGDDGWTFADVGAELRRWEAELAADLLRLGYDVQGRVRPNGEAFSGDWSEAVVPSVAAQVEDKLSQFRRKRGTAQDAIAYWNGERVKVAAWEGSTVEGDLNPDAYVRLHDLISGWDDINSFLVAYKAALDEVKGRLDAFAALLGDAAAKQGLVPVSFALDDRDLGDFADYRAGYDDVRALYDRMVRMYDTLNLRFSGYGLLAKDALSDLQAERVVDLERLRQRGALGGFLRRFGAEQLLASVSQLRYNAVDRTRSIMAYRTFGGERGKLFFNPTDLGGMSFCLYTGAAPASGSACAGTGKTKMTFVYEDAAPAFYNTRPFTRNRVYWLSNVDASGNTQGFVKVGVWDDEWSDLDAQMTNSYLSYGSWLFAPDGVVTGPRVQMGSFVGVDTLGLDGSGNPQTFFSRPVQHFAGGASRLTFQGETEGVYVMGRGPADTQAGTFTGTVRLAYLSTHAVSGTVADIVLRDLLGGGGGGPVTPLDVDMGGNGDYTTDNVVELSPVSVGANGVGDGTAGFRYEDGMNAKQVLHGAYGDPQGAWNVGFVNVDVPSSLGGSTAPDASFAVGVWHAGFNWIGDGGSKGAFSGAFVTGAHGTQ